ncbi:hypothetical protein RhiLY_08357 [Ceratobasidium sp. AG-Ba]|nr:hypothetical protein RhiLY_08357 [Ceratobasidium sp. AG-Ba]
MRARAAFAHPLRRRDRFGTTIHESNATVARFDQSGILGLGVDGQTDGGLWVSLPFSAGLVLRDKKAIGRRSTVDATRSERLGGASAVSMNHRMRGSDVQSRRPGNKSGRLSVGLPRWTWRIVVFFAPDEETSRAALSSPDDARSRHTGPFSWIRPVLHDGPARSRPAWSRPYRNMETLSKVMRQTRSYTSEKDTMGFLLRG